MIYCVDVRGPWAPDPRLRDCVRKTPSYIFMTSSRTAREMSYLPFAPSAQFPASQSNSSPPIELCKGITVSQARRNSTTRPG